MSIHEFVRAPHCRQLPHGLASVAFAVGAFYSTLTPAVPVLLTGRGFTKLDIVVFFAIGSGASGLVNAFWGSRVRRSLHPRSAIAICSLSAVVALTGTALAPSPTQAWVFGALLAPMTLVYPLVVSLCTAETRDDAEQTRATTRLRTSFVTGYVIGLLVITVTQQLLATTQPTVGSAVAPVAFAIVAMVAASGIRGRHRAAVEVTAEDRPSPRHPGDGRPGVSLTALGAMVAAETVRLVYLPLYVVSRGEPLYWISALLVVGVVAEIPALAVVSRLQRIRGTCWTLVAACAAGVVSFVIMFFASSITTLALAQVVFALFTAGVQTVALVFIGDVLRGGAGSAAGTFTVMTQVGALVGIAAPVLVPGFDASLFLLAAGLAALAAGLVRLAAPGRSTRSPAALARRAADVAARRELVTSSTGHHGVDRARM